MKTGKIKEIIEDLRTAVNSDDQDIAVLREKTNEQLSNLDAILQKEESSINYVFIVAILIFLFIGAFGVITSMSNDDLREDVTQKKEIITQYEKVVKNDTVFTHTYIDGKELNISDLLDDNLKLMNKVGALEFKVSLYEGFFKTLENRYGIKVRKDKDLYYLETNKVDSAMLLLSTYRDKVSYDSLGRKWIVTQSEYIKGDKTSSE